ncbi:MAG: ribonuclease Z [Halococcoides sp.]
MHVTFLGTSGAVPTTERNPSAVMLEREGDRLLFDAGEGTQRQMMRYGTGFDVEHVFVTHLHGDHVLGLPGLLQTWDFNDRSDPVAIHVPRGTRGRIQQLIDAVGEPSLPVRIHEVGGGDVALDAGEYRVDAVETTHRTTSVGYVLVESDRKGRFDRQTAEEELGIPPGPKYGRLHRGEPIEHDGRTIQPEDVVGPPRPGRRVVYTGDTMATTAVREAATEADLLIHDATFGEDRRERARQTGHATARDAGELAQRAGASRLALTHISARYAGSADRLREEAAAVFDGETVLARDGLRIDVPFPESA